MKKAGRLPVNNNAANIARQRRVLNKDIKKAATTNTQTVGGAAKKSQTKKKDDVKRTEQKETYVPETVVKDEPQAEVLEQKPQVEQQEAPQAKVDEAPQRPEPKKSDKAFESFTEVFSQGASKDEMTSIMTTATMEMAAKGKGQDGDLAPFAARAALRHSLGEINKKMPGASQKEIREAGAKDPEIGKWVKIADSAGTYLTEAKAEKAQAKAAAAANGGAKAEGTPKAEGATNEVASAADVPVGGAASGDAAAPLASDPFAAAKGGGGAGQVPPGGGDPNEFYKLDPEKQAQMMAEAKQTSESIKTIYTQMWADMMKAQAERHKIMMETMRSISDMVMQTHMNRQQSAQRHQAAFLAYITEAT